MLEESDKINLALDCILMNGGVDGAHHKQWVLDQVVRILAGESYKAWCLEYSGDPEDEQNYYGEWDEGISP